MARGNLMVCRTARVYPHLVIHVESDLLFTSIASVEVGVAKVDQPREHLVEVSHGALHSKLSVADAQFLPSHAGQRRKQEHLGQTKAPQASEAGLRRQRVPALAARTGVGRRWMPCRGGRPSSIS